MWSDNETNIDLLDYRHLVGVTLSIVKNPTLHPTTVGLYGHWGSGKSSLLKMAQQVIEDEVNGVLCVNFNGWLFEGYDDAKTALMDTLLEEIGKKATKINAAKNTLESLSQRVNWMRVAWAGSKIASGLLLGGVGLGLTSGIEVLARAMAEKIDGMDYKSAKEFLAEHSDKETVLAIRDFHRDFAKLLEETKITTLVVFIDDLDRCNPETIIETLEAIKLFLFAPQTVFIIGADERLVEYAVARQFPDLPHKDFKVGRDYLEKLVQFPVRIPPVGQAELETYIRLLFAKPACADEESFEKIRKRTIEDRKPGDTINLMTAEMVQEELGEINPELQDALTLSQYIAPVLAPGMSGNPRQTKRFLNTLMMRREMAFARNVDIEMRVLAKLMLLEHFKKGHFDILAELQTQEQGKPQLLESLEQQILDGDTTIIDEDIQEYSDDTEITPAKDKDLETWLKDRWIVDTWIRLEPQLSDIDLRPYFFFAREGLGFATMRVRSTSPMAQQMVHDLINASEAVRNNAINRATSLDVAESTAIFAELAQRIRNEENRTVHTQHLSTLIKFVGKQPEQQSEFLIFLRSLDPRLLAAGILPALGEMSRGLKDTNLEETILSELSENEVNATVARMAKNQLSDLRSKKK